MEKGMTMHQIPKFVQQHMPALRKAMLEAYEHADPRNSGFKVGAALLTDKGEIFAGTNWEVNVPEVLGKTTHAEQSAISAMVTASGGMSKIVALMGVGGDLEAGAKQAPSSSCGNCREMMMNYASPDMIVIQPWGNSEKYEVYKVGDLLPKRTGVYDADVHGKAVEVPEAADIFARLADLQKQAYAPYSKAPVAVAIRTASGQMYYGVTREDAAYSGFSATQNALGAIITAEGSKSLVDAIFYSRHPLLHNGIIMPSGPDRQALLEHASTPKALRVLSQVKEGTVITNLDELLPNAFVLER